MSRGTTKVLSGAFALGAGLTVFVIALVAILAGLPRLGFDSRGWAVPPALVVSSCLAYTAFRRTFNGLSERWSDEPDPPHIRGWRPRRNVAW